MTFQERQAAVRTNRAATILWYMLRWVYLLIPLLFISFGVIIFWTFENTDFSDLIEPEVLIILLSTLSFIVARSITKVHGWVVWLLALFAAGYFGGWLALAYVNHFHIGVIDFVLLLLPEIILVPSAILYSFVLKFVQRQLMDPETELKEERILDSRPKA